MNIKKFKEFIHDRFKNLFFDKEVLDKTSEI